MQRQRWVDFAWVMVLVPITLNLWAAVRACELPPSDFVLRFGVHLIIFGILVGIPFLVQRLLKP